MKATSIALVTLLLLAMIGQGVLAEEEGEDCPYCDCDCPDPNAIANKVMQRIDEKTRDQFSAMTGVMDIESWRSQANNLINFNDVLPTLERNDTPDTALDCGGIIEWIESGKEPSLQDMLEGGIGGIIGEGLGEILGPLIKGALESISIDLSTLTTDDISSIGGCALTAGLSILGGEPVETFQQCVQGVGQIRLKKQEETKGRRETNKAAAMAGCEATHLVLAELASDNALEMFKE